MPRKTNTDKYREWNRKRQGTKEYKEYLRNYRRIKRKKDLQFKLALNLRSNLWKAIKRNSKSGNVIELLGCDICCLKKYIENQFRDGMNWNNYGEWHIDHKKPLSLFDLTDTKQLKEVCHYTNIQPLWAIDNIKKGNNL